MLWGIASSQRSLSVKASGNRGDASGALRRYMRVAGARREKINGMVRRQVDASGQVPEDRLLRPVAGRNGTGALGTGDWLRAARKAGRDVPPLLQCTVGTSAPTGTPSAPQAPLRRALEAEARADAEDPRRHDRGRTQEALHLHAAAVGERHGRTAHVPLWLPMFAELVLRMLKISTNAEIDATAEAEAPLELGVERPSRCRCDTAVGSASSFVGAA